MPVKDKNKVIGFPTAVADTSGREISLSPNHKSLLISDFYTYGAHNFIF